MNSDFKAVAKGWLLSYANENEPMDQPVRKFFMKSAILMHFFDWFIVEPCKKIGAGPRGDYYVRAKT